MVCPGYWGLSQPARGRTNMIEHVDAWTERTERRQLKRSRQEIAPARKPELLAVAFLPI